MASSSSTSNIRDSKNNKINNQLPASQLAKLPPTQYAVMKTLLAQDPHEMAYTDICVNMKNSGFSQSDIDLALHQLVQEGYMSSFFDEGVFKYMATVDKEGRPSKGDQEMRWDSFNFGLDQIEINLDD